MGYEMHHISGRVPGIPPVCPILDTSCLPETAAELAIVHPTGLSIKEVQDQKREEWN